MLASLSGYEHDMERAARDLRYTKVYTVTLAELSSSSCYLELDGERGRYNSVQFDPYPY